MLNKEEILKDLAKNKALYRKKYNITKIGLFGSFAKNEQTEKSDIDIIIEMETDTPEIFEKKLEIKRNLKEKFHRDVDICTEKYIKPIFRPIILSEAIYV